MRVDRMNAASVAQADVQAAAQANAREAQQAAEQAAEARRQAAEAARQAAEEGRRAADQARREIDRAMRDARREIDAARQSEGVPAQPPWARDFPGGAPTIPEGAIIIAVAFFIMCAVIAVGVPIARAIARRMDRRSVAAPADADTRVRLERIEHAVDAIALEVERISEGQRFSSKLLADMRGLPEAEAAALPASAGRPRDRR